MTVQEIEDACDRGSPPNFSRHPLQTPVLTRTNRYYPFGFPVEVRTNAFEVLQILENTWGRFRPVHRVEPILMEVHVIPGSSGECPPEPTYRMTMPYLTAFADADNYSLVDLSRHSAHVCISHAALADELYAAYHLLSAPLSCISSKHATPIHSACVSLQGHGILLCGDSGAGKSTLSYACARKGWTYTSDDASYLVHRGQGRTVTGNCYQVRFRPPTRELFPETQGMQLTPRAAGKPSVEIPTAQLPGLTCSPIATIESIVFLNRRSEDFPKLVPYRKDVARYVMQESVYGLPETRCLQYETIERLLTAEIYELHYRDLDWAVDRLAQLVQKGQ